MVLALLTTKKYERFATVALWGKALACRGIVDRGGVLHPAVQDQVVKKIRNSSAAPHSTATGRLIIEGYSSLACLPRYKRQLRYRAQQNNSIFPSSFSLLSLVPGGLKRHDRKSFTFLAGYCYFVCC